MSESLPKLVLMQPDEGQVPIRRAPAHLWARFWIVAVALVLAYAGAQSYRSPGPTSALSVYLLGAGRIFQGEEIYRTDEEAFTYPPFFAPPFVPLAMLPPNVAAFLWNVLNGLLAAGTVAMLVTAIRPIVPPCGQRVLAPWAILAAILGARLVIAPVEKASHDGIVLALIVAALFTAIRARTLAAGALLGLAAACKATPLLFLPALLVRRQWAAAAALVIVCLGATKLPDFVFPANSGKPWAAQWYDTFVAKVEIGETANVSGAWRRWNHHNQNLAGTLHRLTAPARESVDVRAAGLPLVELRDGPRQAITLAGLGLILITTLFVCWRAGRAPNLAAETPRAWNLFAVWGVVGSAMLLLSPMSSKQHFGLLVIPVLLASVAVVHYRSRLTPLLVLGLAIVFVFSTCAAKDLVGGRATDVLLAYGSLTWCALACWAMSIALALSLPAALEHRSRSSESQVQVER